VPEDTAQHERPDDDACPPALGVVKPATVPDISPALALARDHRLDPVPNLPTPPTGPRQ